jgi:Flp pilus assembly protein TadD
LKETPDDPKLLSAYAFIEQRHGKDKEARDLYQRALQSRPHSTTASTNLGIIEARSGNLRQAVQLWQEVFRKVPYRSALGIDLAMAFCVAGQKDVARNYVQRVLEFNLDSEQAKRLRAHLSRDPAKCGP